MLDMKPTKVSSYSWSLIIRYKRSFREDIKETSNRVKGVPNPPFFEFTTPSPSRDVLSMAPGGVVRTSAVAVTMVMIATPATAARR